MKITVIGANSNIARNLIYYVKNNCVEDITWFLFDYQNQSVDGYKEYQQINILDRESMEHIEVNVDILFIFAGKTGTAQGFNDYKTYIDVNELGLLNILDRYVQCKSNAKIVFPSSRLVYKGKPGLLKEDSEKEAKTIYAVNKLACERYLSVYHNAYDINYLILRVCVPYGNLVPGSSSYGTAEFMLTKAKNGEDISLYGDGSVRRTLTYMGDLCATIWKAAVCNECVNDVFNVGGEDYCLRDMANGIAGKYDVSVTYVEWPDMAYRIESGDTVFDSSKLDSIILYKRAMHFNEWI